jgi:excisionase family DNA binding protein
MADSRSTARDRDKTEIQSNVVYTLKEVCDILQISPATALRWIKDGKLRPSRIGRGYRFLGAQVLAALGQRSA